MSLMGGLVDTRAENETATAERSHLAEWMIHHAWRLVIVASAVFWAAVAGALYLG